MMRLLLVFLFVCGPATVFAQDGEPEEPSSEDAPVESDSDTSDPEKTEERALEASKEDDETGEGDVKTAEGAVEAGEENDEAAQEAIEAGEGEDAPQEAENVGEGEDAPQEAENVGDAVADSTPEAAGAMAAAPYDKTWLHIWGRLGAAVFPLGVQGTVVLEPRVALHRSESVLFQSTFFGGGLYFRVTPAFLEYGPQISIKPIEIFELNVVGKHTWHYASKNGRVRFDDYSGKSYADRGARPDSPAAASTLYFGVSPVLKLKAGPLIVVYGGSLAYHHILVDDDDDQLFYDAALDLLLFKREWTISHQAVVMAEVLDGEKTAARFRIGATIRQRAALRAKDQTVNLGLITTFKPGRKAGFPEILFLVMPYLRDASGGRVLGPPWIALALTWTVDPPFARKGTQTAVHQTQRAMGQMNSLLPGRPF